jgi:transposase
VPTTKSNSKKAVGIDLGCKEAVACSDGKKITGRWYRKHENQLAQAQRANKKSRVRAIHRKIKNTRNDQL